MTALGPIGRLGRFTAGHFKLVVGIWIAIAIGLGFFAPRAEQALSGAGWQANGSESVQVRDLVQQEFEGLSSAGLMVVVHSPEVTVDEAPFEETVARVEDVLGRSDAVSVVVSPEPGVSISEDGHTAVVQGGAALDPNGMVEAADGLQGDLAAAAEPGVQVALTGASGMWADFNEANLEAMLKSELFSWPVTLAILVVAFGSLVAAGLPVMLTIVGLVAAAGSLFLATQLGDVSIWAMNFAMMFALALGIDYALFIVARFRAALLGSGLKPVEAAAVAMDTAGKAVLFSGVTVLISLSAVLFVPSPAFRSVSLGIMLSVIFVLLATLTLLPAVLAKLGPRVNRGKLKWVHAGEHRSKRFAAWAERLWRRPVAFGLVATALLVAATIPILWLDTGMPSIKVVPEGDQSRQGYVLVQEAFGPGAPGALQIVAPAGEIDAVGAQVAADDGVAFTLPAQPSPGGLALLQAVPTADPSDPAVGDTIERLRDTLPADALVGGAAAENHDLEQALSAATPIVIGVVLGLGFLLLLVALQAPIIAALGVLTNLLATGAAFGLGKIIFQDGHGEGLFGFESQGFVDAWAPVFFFALIFAITMDYTVFLLASAKEHWDRSGNAKEAAVGGLAHSGRTILAAAAVMVAVFFTFALSGPLPPKEMGVILGLAVLLDAALVRLVLLPVLLRLIGRWAWWRPRWLAPILPDVRFGH
jgi:RND superfamily putative drug exporter